MLDDGGLRPNGTYFLDAGFILGKPDGFNECLDVGSRNLEDIGPRLGKHICFSASFFKTNSQTENIADFKVRYFIPSRENTLRSTTMEQLVGSYTPHE